MKYNELQVNANKDRKRVGRGISAGGGKTAGRGTKGQGSRTGKKLHATFQGGQNGIISAIPKHRGFKSKRIPAQVVYTDVLNQYKGETIDNMFMFENGLIATPFHKVKVIARGEVSETYTLKTQAASKSVIEAIKKAGGTFTKVDTPLAKSQKEAEASDK